MASKNLWGNLAELQTVRTPRTILLEQAQYLSEETQGKLIGSVVEINHDLSRALVNPLAEKMFYIEFRIKVPALNNYTYTLFSVEHGINLYPANICVEVHPEPIVCNNEEAFEEKLQHFFQSKYVRDILGKLISQVQ